jgi:hypothetical protein
LVYQTWDPRNEEVNETRDLIDRLTGLVATMDRREIVAASFAPAEMAREHHPFVRRYLKTTIRLMRR